MDLTGRHKKGGGGGGKAKGRTNAMGWDGMVDAVMNSAYAVDGPASHGWNYHLHSVIMFAHNVCTHVKSII